MEKILRGTKTKIIATMGPAIQSEEKIKQLILAGVDVFRLNFSHGAYEGHLKNLEIIRNVSKELDYQIAILQDLQGPKIRLGKFSKNPVTLAEGNYFKLTKEDVLGDETCATLTYKAIIDELVTGDTLLINDGLVILNVVEKGPDFVNAKVVVGGDISDHKGVNIPSSPLKNIPALTAKDLEDLKFGLEHGVDYVAISFVRKASDIDLLNWEIDKQCLKKCERPRIIAKIEKPQALDEIDGILEKVDGIMVARGDLGVEMDITKIPSTQRELINKANIKGKLVITATQMLDSMTNNYTPTRAEVTDVANAVLDGTDAVMLSGETAVGKYPVRVVEIMNSILDDTENAVFKNRKIYRSEMLHEKTPTIPGVVSESVSLITKKLNIKAIVCFTISGNTPLILSKMRPDAPIIAYCMDDQLRPKLNLIWGTIGKVIERIGGFDELIKKVEVDLLNSKLLSKGDNIIIVTGLPAGISGATNTIKVHQL